MQSFVDQRRGFCLSTGLSYIEDIHMSLVDHTIFRDVADPEYKYYNGRHLNSNGITTDGSSYCSYEDAVELTSSWTEKYNVFTNNCQHFVKAMVIFLQSSSCNNVQGRNEIDVSNEIQNILSNCSVVCCGSSGANGTIPAMGLILSFIAISSIFYGD